MDHVIHGGNVWQGNDPAAWLDFSANIRPDGPPDWVKNALMDAMDGMPYYPDPAMKRAKKALAEYLELPTAFVLPTAGGISAIDMATHLESAGMLQFAPCFAEYARLSENRGAKIGNIPILTGRHRIGDPAQQAKGRLLEGCTVWLCNPLNPIGCAFAVGQIEGLLRQVEAKNGWLIVDEAFIPYCPEHSVTGLLKDHERLLIAGSMTKILGIPGVRLGYLCAQPHVLAQISRYQLTWELSCFAEAVLCGLPKHKKEVRAYSETNACRRAHLTKGLEGLGAHVYPSEASFVLADFGRPMAVISQKLKEKGILVRQCSNFEGVNDGCHLRLAVKDEQANNRLLGALREAMTCAENP